MIRELHTKILLCAFAFVSICTGLIVHTGLPDQFYFLGEQLSEILLLCALYTINTNKTIKIITVGLISLSVAEMFDEVLGNNLGFKINDYVLVLATCVVVYKLVTNGRVQRGNNSHYN